MQVWKLKRGGKGEADGIWQGEGDRKTYCLAGELGLAFIVKNV